MTILDNATQRTQAKEMLEECLANPYQLAKVSESVLKLIMENGAPKRYRDQQPGQFLLDSTVSIEVSPRMKRRAIRETLKAIDSMSLEQLNLFRAEDIPGYEPTIRQASLF